MNRVPMPISTASATSCSRSSFGSRSLMDGLTMSVVRQVFCGPGVFLFQDGFVDVVRDRRADHAAGTVGLGGFHHDHDGIFWFFIRRKGGKPEIITRELVMDVL